jgi:hypothetical protein
MKELLVTLDVVLNRLAGSGPQRGVKKYKMNAAKFPKLNSLHCRYERIQESWCLSSLKVNQTLIRNT